MTKPVIFGDAMESANPNAPYSPHPHPADGLSVQDVNGRSSSGGPFALVGLAIILSVIFYLTVLA